jgi:large subunit ribosomal protein L3
MGHLRFTEFSFAAAPVPYGMGSRQSSWRSFPPMSIGILGKKLGMSQFFDDEGRSIPVTLIEAGPCRITQLKNQATDGYAAVQVGFGEIREKLVNRPAKGHLAKSGGDPLRHLREYRVEAVDGFELGSPITVGAFEAGQKVDVSGDTIGRGFAGYQKRHGFSRGPMSHGSKNHREPGSTGAGTTPGRVYPGKRMAGRYGGKQITTRGLTILKIDAERNLLVVKGSVPGKPGALLDIRPARRVGSKAAN